MAVALAVAAVLTIALRIAYIDAPLTRDEGGDAFIAQASGSAGPFAYGRYFVDRSPLLLGAYRLGDLLAGPIGIRILGLLAALALVGMTALLAARLAGQAAAAFAAAGCAALLCSQATGVLATPSELLAAAPSCLCMTLLVTSQCELAKSPSRLVAAGAAAAAALLIKQSFADALAAGVAGMGALMAVRPAEWTNTLRRAESFVGGTVVIAAGLVVWAAVEHRTPHAIWYAIGGFRVDAAPVLAQDQLGRLARLETPLLHSGLVLAVPIALMGFARLRGAIEVRTALMTWLVVGALGVLASGSYFPAYLIEVMAASSVGLGVVGAARPRLATMGLAAVAALALLPTVRGISHDSADAYGQQARALGQYVRARALPHQTIYVLYARASILYYAGLPSPFPYHWALMMRTIQGAQPDLRALLAGPDRPTWIVEQDSPSAFGLDRSGATRRLLAERYRKVAVLCSRPILLALGKPSGPPPPRPPRCT